MKRVFIMGAMAILAVGCSKLEGMTQGQLEDSQIARSAISPKFSLCVYNANASGAATGTAIYCDKSSSSALQLQDGRQYVISLAEESGGGPFTYKMNFQRVDILGAMPTTVVTLKVGNTLVTAPGPGDYALKVAAAQGETLFPARSFQAAVNCASSVPLSSSGINMGAVSVSLAGDNLYNFSAGGAVGASTGGIAPYLCAWDFNGDGARDSVFDDCSKAINNVYVNTIGDRNIGLLVKDSCNNVVSAAASKNVALGGLASRTPGDGTVFIHGQVSNETGAAAVNLGVKGVNYWATNNAVMKPVQPNWTYNGADSSFTIGSDEFTYGQPSSVHFGMKLFLSHINVVLGDSVATSSADVSNMQMTRLEYSTDQAGDALPQMVMSSSSCTLSIKGAKVIKVEGKPCGPGSSPKVGTADTYYTLHVWGAYSCTNVTGSGGNADIAGEFDGAPMINTGCVGGGQGGQGGIFPINA